MSCPRRRRRRWRCSRARPRSSRRSSTCRSSRGSCTWPRAWCARSSGRSAPGSFAPPARRARARRSRSTSPCRRAARSRRACTGTTRRTTRCVQVGPPPRGGRADDRRHRHPVAHRLALPRARLPAHLLGRGHDARPAARGRRLGRARRLALHALPRPRRSRALVGADGVHEWPVAVVAFGGEPALEATGEAAAGEVDAAPVEFPLETAAQRAGDADTLGEPWERGAPVDVPEQARTRSSRSSSRAARSGGWTRPRA